VIARDPECAYRYARYVIGGRWPEAERRIAIDRWAAEEYAKHVIRGPWPEAKVHVCW